MLRANVGLSRKLSKDFNSAGFTINLDGEIVAPPSDAEAVMEQIKELFDLAEEALNQQIERAGSDEAIASHDDRGSSSTNAPGNGASSNGRHQSRVPSQSENGHPQTNGQRNGDDHVEEPATNKQITYLLTLGKRQNLSTAQVDQKIAEVLGRNVGLYDLSKKAAAMVIDVLSGRATNGRSRVRY